MEDTFLYFAYGSNLLRERLRLQNPSATFVTTAQLKNYRLVFTCLGFDPYKMRWKGAAANIQETTGQSVWGCVWRIGNQHKETLDRQETLYTPVQVTVTGSDDIEYACRVYQVPDVESKMAERTDNRPSPFYLDVIIKGAKQNGICDEYVNDLEKIEHNGVTDAPNVYLETMKMVDNNGER